MKELKPKYRYHWKLAEIEAACKSYCALAHNDIKGGDINKNILEKLKTIAPKDCAPGTYHLRGDRVYPYLRDNVFTDIRYFEDSLRLVEKSKPVGCSRHQRVNMALAIHLGETKVMDYKYKDFDGNRWRFYSSWLHLRKLPMFLPPFDASNESSTNQDDAPGNSEKSDKSSSSDGENSTAKSKENDNTTTPINSNVVQQPASTQGSPIDTTCAAAPVVNTGSVANVASPAPTQTALPATAPTGTVPTYVIPPMQPPPMQVGATMKAMANFQQAMQAAMAMSSATLPSTTQAPYVDTQSSIYAKGYELSPSMQQAAAVAMQAAMGNTMSTITQPPTNTLGIESSFGMQQAAVAAMQAAMAFNQVAIPTTARYPYSDITNPSSSIKQGAMGMKPTTIPTATQSPCLEVDKSKDTAGNEFASGMQQAAVAMQTMGMKPAFIPIIVQPPTLGIEKAKDTVGTGSSSGMQQQSAISTQTKGTNAATIPASAQSPSVEIEKSKDATKNESPSDAKRQLDEKEKEGTSQETNEGKGKEIARKRKRDGNHDEKFKDLVNTVHEINDMMRQKNNVHLLTQAIDLARDPVVKKRLEEKLIKFADSLEF